MQVTYVNDTITHAIIGGGEAIEFGISSSAEFYNILSSTLYKDQILAVVREGLCNAWDAHIEAGTTHKPIEITVKDGVFSIKDSGKGIHKNDIGPIYCVYGNSTKKNDGNQTGGFGLGCKSPYAYVDHFEVISCHEGVKTIYSMSKASPKTGKPGAVPIASFPTEDTGLQVSIRIKNNADRDRFYTLIKRIVYNGGMNATYNGERLPTIEFDTTKNNYVITNKTGILDNMTTIMIRYGNVIYPVDAAENIKDLMDNVANHLAKINNNGGYTPYRLILQAPPHSIAVTPSRESLSMQEHTVATINSLLAGFMKDVKSNFEPACRAQAKQSIIAAVKEEKIPELLDYRDVILPGMGKVEKKSFISDMETQALMVLSTQYPDSLEFRKWDLNERLTGLVAKGLLDRGMVQSYLRELTKVDRQFHPHRLQGHYGHQSSWLTRQVLAPVVIKLQKAGMPSDALSVYDPYDLRAGDRTNLAPAMAAKVQHHFCAMPYLRNIVVLSCSRSNITERLYHKHPVFKKLGSYPGFLFYHVGLKKADKDAARAFWAKSGMVVVDIIDRQDYEPEPERRPTKTKEEKAVKVGLAKMSCFKNPSTNEINVRRWRLDDVARTTNPECVVQVVLDRNSESSRLNNANYKTTHLLVDLFGDVCGVVPASNTLQKYTKQGIPTLHDYMVEKIKERFDTPAFQEYFSCSFEVEEYKGIKGDFDNSFLEMIYKTPELQQHFGIPNPLSKEDHKYMDLFMSYQKGSSYYHPDWVKEIWAMIKKIPSDPINATVCKNLVGNKLLGIIHTDTMKQLLASKETTQAEKKKAIEAILTILN